MGVASWEENGKDGREDGSLVVLNSLVPGRLCQWQRSVSMIDSICEY